MAAPVVGARRNRTWRQTIGGIIGMGTNTAPSPMQLVHPAHMAGAGGGIASASENVDENVMPSVELQKALRDKAWKQKLEVILKDLVMARRTYLNHADENWQNFLDRCQAAYRFFEEKDPERGYRENFTIENYRMLFQRESSAYRDDVCRGVKRIRDGMWVNGEEVKFAKELVDEGFDLASRGEKLMDLVFVIDDLDMHSGLDQVHVTTRAITLERFRCALRVFDHRYRIFEKNYIEALIAVEKQSRSLVQTVAELIKTLSENNQLVNQQLLNHFAVLNKKSRDCFNCEYSYQIMRVVLDRDYQGKIHRRLWHLPEELLESFQDTCNYLKDLLPKILRVHPKLEHNPGLVQRLEKFHDTYRRVVSYIKLEDNPMSEFCDFLDRVLTDDYRLDGSVDSILLIPRLFCLYVWENRGILAQEEFVKTPLGKLVHELAPELLVELSAVFCGSDIEGKSADELAELIVKHGVNTASPSEVAKQLEVVSMKLQRTNANQWNSFVSVILHEEEEEEEKRARPRLPSV